MGLLQVCILSRNLSDKSSSRRQIFVIFESNDNSQRCFGSGICRVTHVLVIILQSAVIIVNNWMSAYENGAIMA